MHQSTGDRKAPGRAQWPMGVHVPLKATDIFINEHVVV